MRPILTFNKPSALAIGVMQDSARLPSRARWYDSLMEGAIERFEEKTGLCLPLAARMVSVILDSGASDWEARAAMKIVDAVLVMLPIKRSPWELPEEQEHSLAMNPDLPPSTPVA